MTDTTALYRYFDDDNNLLYVGIAIEPFRRMAHHRNKKTWWDDVAHVELENFPTRAAALEAERSAIQDEHPKYNVTHNRRPQTLIVGLFCTVCDQRIGPGGYLEVDHQAVANYRQAEKTAEQKHRENDPTGWGAWDMADVLAMPGQVEWNAYHPDCDPNPGSHSYWIGVERISTVAQLLERTAHLMEKAWLDCTNWDQVLAGAAAGFGPLRLLYGET